MNTKKTAITIVAAMMAIAMITTVAMAVICEKPCGTKVEQCDNETVFALTFNGINNVTYGFTDMNMNGVLDGALAGEDKEGAYLDMDNTGTVSAGDIRLSDTCGQQAPNTKVESHESDCLSVLNRTVQDVFKYADRDGLAGYSLGDPVYLDADFDGAVSYNDIALTDVYDSVTDQIRSRWDRVDTFEEDVSQPWQLFSLSARNSVNDGTAKGLLGYIDSDCSGSWTCPDKLYLQQIQFNATDVGLWNFNNFTTIGDLRLYIPPDDCLNVDCGTKVEQCAKDAVYALRYTDTVQYGFNDENDNGKLDPLEGAYLDMNGDGNVTTGDVRISDACGVYDANTKVKHPDAEVVGDPITLNTTVQNVFKYHEYDNLPGARYSLGDPVYLDADFSGNVTIGDVALTDVYDYSDNQIRTKWERLTTQEYDTLFAWGLTSLPARAGKAVGTPNGTLGYIDSDCSGSWTCPDKLYLEQMVNASWNTVNYDLIYNGFVTIGDLRLYIPPDAVGSGPGEPCWIECGTKVEQCDVDDTYVLRPAPTIRFGYVEWGAVGSGYDLDDDAYLDMDNNGRVTRGDIRLSTACGDYDPNTKVGHDDDSIEQRSLVIPAQDIFCYLDINSNGFDLADPMYIDVDNSTTITVADIRLTDCPVYNESSTPWGGAATAGSVGLAWSKVKPGDSDLNIVSPVPLTHIGNGNASSVIRIMDGDCSQGWTCPDKLYLQQRFDDFVTIGDERLYIPPSNETSGPVTPVSICDYYDDPANGGDGDTTIDKAELVSAILDYMPSAYPFGTGGLFTKSDLVTMILAYLPPGSGWC